MSDEIFDSFDADNYPLCDFGIIEKGSFNLSGGMDNWKGDAAHLGESLPRWLLKESVLSISGGEVYLRGLHSRQLSKERRAAMALHRLRERSR